MPIDPSKPFDLSYKVDPNWIDMRLDQFVKAMIPSMSRTKIQKYIKNDRVEVNNEPRPANWRVRLGDDVLIRCYEPEGGSDCAKYIPLEFIYEDDDIAAINKQTGLVVHPVGKHRHDTLLNALYWHYKDRIPEDQEISLANRIDQYTSGIILVTKHTKAKQLLQEDFEARIPKKAYFAIVEGVPSPSSGKIDLPLGKSADSNDHCMMGVRTDEEGKPSLTNYLVIETFEQRKDAYSLVRLEPHTGRQHQLRVHMSCIGHPLVCDVRYGSEAALVVKEPEGGIEKIINRYALHAAEITLRHPISKNMLTLSAPIARDMAEVLAALRAGGTPSRQFID